MDNVHPVLRHPKDKPFLGVAMAFILVGVVLLAYGLVLWLYNYITVDTGVSMPAAEVLGGLLVTAAGYIILELELMRTK